MWSAEDLHCLSDEVIASPTLRFAYSCTFLYSSLIGDYLYVPLSTLSALYELLILLTPSRTDQELSYQQTELESHVSENAQVLDSDSRRRCFQIRSKRIRSGISRGDQQTS